MKSRLAALGISVVLAACGGGGSNPTAPSTPSQPTQPTVISVTVSGTAAFSAVGETRQLTATATMSNGSTQNVTSQATWQSSNVAIVTVNASGLATAVGSGTASITATYQSRQSTPLTVEVRLTPNISGTWRGRYFALDGSGSDGQMTWQLTQSGSTFAGTFSITGDLIWGTVAGSIQGQFKAPPQQQSFSFAVNVPQGGIAEFRDCTMTMTGDVGPLTGTPTVIEGVYATTWCGRSFLPNGNLQLFKQ